MGKISKLVQRFKSKPKDFTYEELCRIMKSLGYSEDNQGKLPIPVLVFIMPKPAI
jgi:hypothetical protein